jgi:hypothetical protein
MKCDCKDCSHKDHDDCIGCVCCLGDYPMTPYSNNPFAYAGKKK